MTPLQYAIIRTKIDAARAQIAEIEQMLLVSSDEASALSAAPSKFRAPKTEMVMALIRESKGGLRSRELVEAMRDDQLNPEAAIWTILSRLKKAGRLELLDGRWCVPNSPSTGRHPHAPSGPKSR